METEKKEEVNKYLEPMLFLTPNGDNFAIRCHKDEKGVYYYSVREFINNIYRDVIPPEAAESLYVRVLISLPHDMPFLLPKEIQFLGPYERPLPCITIAGLSIVYHYFDKKNMILTSQKTYFEAVLADCIAGNESKHVRLHDDGQVRIHEQEYAQGMVRGESLDRRPPKGSIAVFDPSLYYSDENIKAERPIPFKTAMAEKLAELKSMKGAHGQEVEKLKAEIRELMKEMKKKEEILQTLKMEEKVIKIEDRRKKQKGEAFPLRAVVSKLNFDITTTQFNLLSQRISTIMKESYPDRPTFMKMGRLHFYPDERNLLEILVMREMVQVVKDTAGMPPQ